MAVATNHLTTSFSETDATSYETASISPSGSNLILAAVQSRAGSATTNTPTLSGNGITWEEVDTVIDSGNLNRLTLFRGMVASPSAGAVTIDFAGQTQLRSMWAISEFSGIDTSGTNGSAAIVQSETGLSEATDTGLTITLGAFSHADNATFGVARKGITLVEGSGFTELGEAGDSTSGFIQTQFKASNDTSVDWSWASNGTTALAIAVEIRVSTDAGNTGNPMFFTGGGVTVG